MSKYSKNRTAHICSLIKKDSYTIDEICSLSGISVSVYYEWLEKKPEFLEAITRAREQWDENLVKEARISLMKKVKGYTVQETKTVTVDSGKKDEKGKSVPKIKERVVTDKHFQPDSDIIKFVLTNKDPQNFQNRQNTELTGKDGKELFIKISDEDLDKRITELERKLKSDDKS